MPCQIPVPPHFAGVGAGLIVTHDDNGQQMLAEEE